jgi:hypothetical protein
MKDAPDEGFRPGRTGSSLLWDEGNRRDGDQPARRGRTRRGGKGCGRPLRLCRRERRGSGGSPLGADASRFDWDLVEDEITIRITDCGCAGADPGEIILDEEILTNPRFGPKYAWGIVQHEYAHQVDFFLLDARDRRRVRQWLGGSDWCYEDPDVDHDDHACERFASSLAWAYWARPRRNIMAVHTAVTAAEFREVPPRLLGPDDESIASQGLPRRRSSPTLRQVS